MLGKVDCHGHSVKGKCGDGREEDAFQDGFQLVRHGYYLLSLLISTLSFSTGLVTSYGDIRE